MNYFDALSTLLNKKDREDIRNELLEQNIHYADLTIYNVIRGDSRYSPEILEVVHNKAIEKLIEIQKALKTASPTANED